MDNHEINAQLMKISSARKALLVFIVLTTINIVLMSMDTDFFALFFAISPLLFIEMGRDFFPMIAGIILAFTSLSVYLLCWRLSKAHLEFMLLALIFVSVELTLYVLIEIYFLPPGGSILFNESITMLALYGWVIYHLVIGTFAWRKLRNAPAEETEAEKQELPASELSKEQANSVISEIDDAPSNE